ncbi:MAG: hypothetical protein NZ703_01870 [Gemmataceae bacterium]|nr:hypothetical protein [Gemmataceae bacterium]
MLPQPQLRRDPLSGRWAIIAPERAARPHSAGHRPTPRRDGDHEFPCPFCPGQEEQTPPAVLVYPASVPPTHQAGLPGTTPTLPWRVRVVPNRYPAVRPEASWPYCLVDGPWVAAPAAGRSEVVIETPLHLADPGQLPVADLVDVFRAYRDRLLALAAEGWAYAAVFKNVGAEAGASLVHTHSQIITLPLIPPLALQQSEIARHHFQRTGQCLICTLVESEIRSAERLISDSRRFAVLTAYAPRFPYELWLVPRSHLSRFEDLDDQALLELAGLWKRVLAAVDAVCDQPAYNWILHTAPWGLAATEWFHWRLELLPRLAQPAGLEWGFGCFICSVVPEHAAAQLRDALPPSG